MSTTVQPKHTDRPGPVHDDGGLRPRPWHQALVLRLASWSILAMSGLIFVGFAGALFGSSAPFSIGNVEAVCGAAPLDVRPYSTANEVHQFLAVCGQSGRVAYRNLQLADLFYPAISGLFMASAMVLTATHLFPRRPSMVGLAALPLLGSGFDYTENVFAWRALAAYPDAAGTDSLLGLASLAKTGTFWLAGILLLVGLAGLVVKTASNRLRPQGLSRRGPAAAR